MRLYITTILIILCQCSVVISQDTFNKLYTHYFQLTANRLIEYNEKVYFTGIGLDTLNPFFENNIQMSSIDLNGNLLNHILYDNPAIDDELGLPNFSRILSYDGRLILPYAEGAADDCVLEFDESLSSADLIECYNSNDPTLGYSTMEPSLYHEDELVVFLSNREKRLIFVSIDLLQRREHTFHNLSKPGYEYHVNDTHVKGDTLVVFGNYEIPDPGGDRTGDELGYFIMDIGEDLEIIEERFFPFDIEPNITWQHSLIDHEGYLIMTFQRLNRTLFNETGQRFMIPTINKIDIATGDIIWESVMGDASYERVPDRASAIVESHDKDGYIIVGNKPQEPERNLFGVTYMKYDSNGNLIWSHDIADDNPRNARELGDVLASSDGFYFAGGYRFDRDHDETETLVQAWIIKFDEDGDLALLSDTEDIQQDLSIQIYPNPAEDYITIRQESSAEITVLIANNLGQEVVRKSGNETEMIVPIVTLLPGQYHVLVMNDNNELLRRESIVKK